MPPAICLETSSNWCGDAKVVAPLACKYSTVCCRRHAPPSGPSHCSPSGRAGAGSVGRPCSAARQHTPVHRHHGLLLCDSFYAGALGHVSAPASLCTHAIADTHHCAMGPHAAPPDRLSPPGRRPNIRQHYRQRAQPGNGESFPSTPILHASSCSKLHGGIDICSCSR